MSLQNPNHSKDLLILYDIPSALPDKAWSPNTWKIRFVLNIKKIPYETRWLVHPQIEPEMRCIRAAPATHFFSRTQRYTLPVIWDPRTEVAVSDSSAIVAHLESHYPEAPVLLSETTRAQQLEFVATHIVPLERAIFPLVVLRNAEILSVETRAEWRARREEWLGQRLEDVAPPGEKRIAALSVVLKELSTIGFNSPVQGDEPKTLLCSHLSYCDVALAAALVWMRRLLGQDCPEWIAVMGADNGRWKRLIGVFEQWETVDESSCSLSV